MFIELPLLILFSLLSIIIGIVLGYKWGYSDGEWIGWHDAFGANWLNCKEWDFSKHPKNRNECNCSDKD